MPTRTQSRTSSSSSTRSRSGRDSPNSGRSTFIIGESVPIIGAALAGAAIGLAANFGRKALIQGREYLIGDWDEILSAEHDEALAIFDKMLATDETQTFKRRMLMTKLCYGLDKHAYQEENVVYPALREANEVGDADALESEHGHIKTFIYELGQMGPDSPNWLEKVREFRQFLSEHAHFEEEQVFPRFKREMSGEQNDKITAMVNRDGFWMA